MEFTIKLHTIKSGRSIVYIQRWWVIISKNTINIDVIQQNSANPVYTLFAKVSGLQRVKRIVCFLMEEFESA